MADLRVNDISPQLKKRLKIAAAKADKTMRNFVIDTLTKAVPESKEQPNAK